jgi:hypothetical protein
MAYLEHMDDISSVHNPDGSAQRLTQAELTEVVVRAAIRNLIENELVEVGTLAQIEVRLGQGVTVR